MEVSAFHVIFEINAGELLANPLTNTELTELDNLKLKKRKINEDGTIGASKGKI